MKKKLPALLLVLALLLATAGCGLQSERQTGFTGERAPSPTLVRTEEKTYFEDVWRGDVSFSEMAYERYEAEWFSEYTAPVYSLARRGGSAEDFGDADYALTDELYYVYTLLLLAELKNAANPADAAAEEEYLYAQELFYRLNDEYRLAMRALAVSPRAALLEDAYGADWAALFAAYEGADEDALSLYHQEGALIGEYYRLMAQDEPDTEAVGHVFLQLIELRNTMAELYGYDSCAEYAYDALYYRDYGPGDAQTVWAGAREFFVPLLQAYGRDVAEQTALLLSDERLDCGADAILRAMGDILPGMSTELNAAFEYMLEYGLYDLEYDPAKANTGYTEILYYYNEPFIFNCPYGEFRDYTDTVHEFGHFANAFYTQSDLLFGMSDMDLSELQSQGLEMLFTRYYGEIFGEYADAARAYALMNMVESVVDGALYDEFQQRVYAEPDPTLERVNEIFAELYEDYGYEPYAGCETGWMYVSHNFDRPFYYISYCVSALGALELYRLSVEDWDAALDKYLTVCAMDTEAYYFSEALEETGLSDVFSKRTYGKVAAALEQSFR